MSKQKDIYSYDNCLDNIDIILGRLIDLNLFHLENSLFLSLSNHLKLGFQKFNSLLKSCDLRAINIYVNK